MSFFEAAGAVAKVSLRLEIMNFNQVKLVQIQDTHCILLFFHLLSGERFAAGPAPHLRRLHVLRDQSAASPSQPGNLDL